MRCVACGRWDSGTYDWPDGLWFAGCLCRPHARAAAEARRWRDVVRYRQLLRYADATGDDDALAYAAFFRDLVTDPRRVGWPRDDRDSWGRDPARLRSFHRWTLAHPLPDPPRRPSGPPAAPAPPSAPAAAEPLTRVQLPDPPTPQEDHGTDHP